MPDPGRSSLVLIPGLGSDAALYEPQRRALGDRLVVPPWISPLDDRETLDSYARRLAEVIRGDPRVVKPFFVGGISFGGMLAAEIAECCSEDVAGLILIGGCTDQSEIPGIFRLLALAGQHVPTGLAMPLTRRLAPAVISWWQGLSPEDGDLFASVYGRGNIGLLKWGADAMRRWESAIVVNAPVYRAHGRRDDVIPIPEHKMEPGRDLVVPDARHLISLTHAEAVNRWLLEVMDGVASSE